MHIHINISFTHQAFPDLSNAPNIPLPENIMAIHGCICGTEERNIGITKSFGCCHYFTSHSGIETGMCHESSVCFLFRLMDGIWANSPQNPTHPRNHRVLASVHRKWSDLYATSGTASASLASSAAFSDIGSLIYNWRFTRTTLLHIYHGSNLVEPTYPPEFLFLGKIFRAMITYRKVITGQYQAPTVLVLGDVRSLFTKDDCWHATECFLATYVACTLSYCCLACIFLQ